MRRAASSSPSRPNKLIRMEDSIGLPAALTGKVDVPRCVAHHAIEMFLLGLLVLSETVSSDRNGTAIDRMPRKGDMIDSSGESRELHQSFVADVDTDFGRQSVRDLWSEQMSCLWDVTLPVVKRSKISCCQVSLCKQLSRYR